MSPCRRQAVSHIGWRLMVASSAKISRPRWPDWAAGPSDFTLLRNASISARGDAVAGCLPASVGAGVRSFAMGPGSGSISPYKCDFARPAQWPKGWETLDEARDG